MSLSLTDERQAHREWSMLAAPGTVEVVIGVRWFDGICVHDDESDEKVWARFRRMTYGDYWGMERPCTTVFNDGIRTKSYIDVYEMRLMILRRLLVDWSLDIGLEIDEETGWLTDSCFGRVKRVYPALLMAFLSRYEESVEVTADEERVMDRQSARLFAKNTKGVENPCEAVSLFCVLSNFWEKFGLNRFQIKDLPYREYLLLRFMMSKESDALARSMKAAKPKKPTMIAGPGGMRPSRAIVVGD